MGDARATEDRQDRLPLADPEGSSKSRRIEEDRDATPESRGLLAIAEGFHLLELDDHRQLELSMPVYDALHAWCKHAAEERR